MVKTISFLFFIPLICFFAISSNNPAKAKTLERKKIIKAEAYATNSCNCTVTQGSFTSPLPLMSSNTSAVNFYSYNNPLTSSANTGLEIAETMLLMLYEDQNTGATSLILILDAANDPTGGSGTVTFNCLPSSAFVEFSDDSGELTGSPPTIVGNFSWSSCCTDGGIIGGVGCGHTITINPSITSGINLFSLVYGTPGAPIYVDMPEINCPITINCGGASCCDEAFDVNATTQNESCSSVSDGFIDISTACAASPSFAWSNGAETEDLMNIEAGTYTVTITDLNGCSQIKSYTIDADSPSPNTSITGPTEFCSGETVTLGVTGVYDAYLWSTGATSPSISVSGSGVYSVIVTNSGGCSATASITVVENPVPDLAISGPSSYCEGDTIILDAGPGFDVYLWSTGDFTQTIEVSQFGTYFVSVLNEFGCSDFDIIDVTPLNIPLPEIEGPTNICSQNLISLNAGEGYESYLWSNGANTQTIVTSQPGTYYVTVTNYEGCEGSTDIVITNNPADTMLIFQTSCMEGDTGIFVNEFINRFGCDSIEILTIAYSESDSILSYDQSCMPQDTGTFIQIFTNQFGCDSIVIEYVSLALSNNIVLQDSSCNVQDTGLWVQNLTNQFGCDSMVITTVSLLPKDTTFLFGGSCDPMDEGIVNEMLINRFGCDSLVITTTTYSLADTSYQFLSSCDPVQSGVFNDLYVGNNGCDSLVITTIALIPPDTTMTQAFTCDLLLVGSSVMILSDLFGCDSIVITNTSLLPKDTTLLQDFTCDPGQAGPHVMILANEAGCDSIVITDFSVLPPDTTVQQAFSCDLNQIGSKADTLMNKSGCDSIIITLTSPYPHDTTFIIFETCLATDTGLIITTLPNQFGCDSLILEHTVLKSLSDCTLTAQIHGDTIGCNQSDGSLLLTIYNGSPPMNYQWTDQLGKTGTGIFGQIGTPIEITGLKEGSYTIEINDPQGLKAILTAIIIKAEPIVLNILPTSSYNGFDVSCYGRADGEAQANITSGGFPPYTFSWSNGVNSDHGENLSSGWQFITVADTFGCETQESIFLLSPDSLNYFLSVANPDCFTNGLGSISIDQISGGATPYNFILNQRPLQTSPLFNGLNSGNYLVVVLDANGCRDSSYLSIDPYIEMTVSLGRDTVILYGDSITLHPLANIDRERIDTIFWDGVDCPGCFVVTTKPTSSTNYVVTIVDTTGCEASDEIMVQVRQNYTVNIPNVFTPGTVGGNDHFTVYGGSNLVLIKKLSIYDRWGELIFRGSDIVPGDPASGWDGTFNGHLLDPAVFVYVVEVEFIDGSTKQFVGDITLIH